MGGYAGEPQQHGERPQGQYLVREREFGERLVEAAQGAHHRGFDLGHVVREQQRAQARGDRERRDEPANDRVAVGLGHRSEDVALDAA